MEGLISIIIPVYNVERYLKRCLDSLINQTYKNIEILLIDDSSTDGSASICKEYTKIDNRIHYYLKENSGAGLSRSFGLLHANGDYLGFCDADDYVEKDMYEKMISFMTDNCDLVCCWHTDENASIRSDNKKIFVGRDIENLILGAVGTEPSAKLDERYGSSVWRGLYKSSIIKDHDISFMSERDIGSEDLIFNLEYLKYCSKVVYLDDQLYHHCINSGSMTRSWDYFHLDHELALYKVVEDMLASCMHVSYKYELQRMFIKRIRMALITISKAADQTNYSSCKNAIKDILEDKDVTELISGYPWYRLPVKQAIFYLCMKYRLVRLILLLGPKGKRL